MQQCSLQNGNPLERCCCREHPRALHVWSSHAFGRRWQIGSAPTRTQIGQLCSRQNELFSNVGPRQFTVLSLH
jgi:hypothetical protein